MPDVTTNNKTIILTAHITRKLKNNNMKKYWKNQEQKNDDSVNTINDKKIKGNLEQFLDIFEDGTSEAKSSRRDFLKLCGYSLAITTVLASCENMVHKAIPYLNKPEEITPGKANFYASTYINGSEHASILVKTLGG